MKTNYNLGNIVRVTDSRNRKFFGKVANICDGVLTVTFKNHHWKFCTAQECEYFSPFRVWFWKSFPSPAKRFGVKVVFVLAALSVVFTLVKLFVL